MHWITSDLAIGSAYLDSDKQELDRQGIRAVLQLNEGDERWPAHWQTLHLPVGDSQPVDCAVLHMGCAFVQAQRAAGRPTLVQCLMGQSRSSSFVFACLLADGHTPAEAWRLLKAKHPGAAPHPVLLQSVLACAGVPLAVTDLYAIQLERE
jgi:protein-tyrosine phosphatase